jgi:chromosome segregation ATPase
VYDLLWCRKEKVEGLLEELAKERSRMSELKGAAGAGAEAAAQATAQLEALRTEMAGKAEEAGGLRARIDSLEAQLTAEAASMVAAAEEHSMQRASLQARIEELQREVANREGKLGETDKARAEAEAAARVGVEASLYIVLGSIPMLVPLLRSSIPRRVAADWWLCV